MLSKAPIKYFAKVGAGQGAPQRETDFSIEGFPFIRAGSIEGLLSGGDEMDLPKVHSEIAKEYRLKLYPPNTIVFAKSGMSAMKGRIYKLKNPCYVVNHLATLELNENAFPDYIVYTLRKFSPVRLINDISYPSLKQSKIENYEIPFPSLPEQIQMADILNKAENLLIQRRKSIDLLDDFLRSTFLELFYTNSNVNKWNETRFAELAEEKQGSMRTGPFGSSLLHGEFTEEGDVKVLGIDNVVNNRFEWKRSRCISFEKFQDLKRYQVFPGDVLISIMATLGRTAVVPNDIPVSINSKHLAAITLNKEIANPHFIAFAFHSHPVILRQLKSKTKGAIMDGLNLTIIKKINFKLPPIVLQNQFASIICKTETLKEQYQNSLQELENLYGSISQQVFSA